MTTYKPLKGAFELSDVQNGMKAADEVFCSSCGAIIKMKAEICPKCGVRQKPAARSSNWLILFILSLVVGCFGVDRFYVGKVVTGTLKMVLGCITINLWIVLMGTMVGVLEITNFGVNTLYVITNIFNTAWAFWWLIDFIMVCLGKFTDSKGNAITRGN